VLCQEQLFFRLKSGCCQVLFSFLVHLWKVSLKTHTAVIESSVFWDVMLQPLATYFMLFSCLYYSSTQKMEAACSSKTVVDFQQTAWRYIPEDRTLQDVILFQGMLGWPVHEKCHVCFKVLFRSKMKNAIYTSRLCLSSK
jgi:hypothetical protein